MSAMDRVTTLSSDFKGEGLCPVCHQDRTAHGCSTQWDTKLEGKSLGRERGWRGHLTVFCRAFPNDRDELAERMNAYHVKIK